MIDQDNSKQDYANNQPSLTQDQKEELAKKIYDLLLEEISVEKERLGR